MLDVDKLFEEAGYSEPKIKDPSAPKKVCFHARLLRYLLDDENIDKWRSTSEISQALDSNNPRVQRYLVELFKQRIVMLVKENKKRIIWQILNGVEQ